MLGIEYQLKPSGHRHALLESSGRRTDWQFDAHYRLTQETISSDTAGPNGSAAYTYDAVGNRQTRTSTLGLLSNQSLSYNANDWLATDTYDSSGNTTASEGNADTYDFLNRLIRRITPTLALLDYEYNAEGILIAKTKNNNREEYHIDGNNPTGYAQVVETFFDTGSGLELTATHHYGHDLVSVYQTNGSTWQRHFYLYDGLGSVRALANEIGTVTDTYTYDAFGTLLHTAGSTANPYRYTGERFDPDLGMYYLRARYMNTNTGRFWTMDSYEGRNSDPNTLHKYLYANANPVMYVDPSGMVGLSFAMSLHTRLITFAAKWNYYAFASGGVVLGRYFQALGRISERVVNSVVMSYQNIFVLPSARIDHLFRIGNNLIAIETKYSAARPGTEGFHRLINQISYMASQPNVTQVYVYFTKEPTAAQLRHITNAAGNRFSIIVGPQQLDAILKSFGAQ